MLKRVIIFGLLTASSQAFGLARAFSCKQVKMAPEEIQIDGNVVPFGAQQVLIVSKVTASSTTSQQFMGNVVATGNPQVKAQVSSADLNLVISKTEGRSSDGDYGYLAQFSGRGYSAQQMICWFFKHSK